MSDLKRCPFCGGEAQAEFELIGEKGASAVYYVNCLSCESGTKFHVSPEKAREVWNNRPDAVVALPSASPNTESLAIALWDRMLKCYDYAIGNDMLSEEFEGALREWRSAKADIS